MTILRKSPSGPVVNILNSILPLVSLTYVDIGTAVPPASQDGSIASPYGSIQAAVDAGKFLIQYVSPIALEPEVVVVPPGTPFFALIGSTVSAIQSVTVPDGCTTLIKGIAVDTFTAGNNCGLHTDQPISSLTMGTSATVDSDSSIFGGSVGDNSTVTLTGQLGAFTTGLVSFVILSGITAMTFAAGVDSTVLGNNLTMGAGSTFNGTNCVLSSGITVNADTVQLFGSTSRANINAVGIDAQNCAFTTGAYTAQVFQLQDVKCGVGTTYNVPNTPGAFQIDGYTNYFLKTNGCVISNPAARLITEDLDQPLRGVQTISWPIANPGDEFSFSVAVPGALPGMAALCSADPSVNGTIEWVLIGGSVAIPGVAQFNFVCLNGNPSVVVADLNAVVFP